MSIDLAGLAAALLAKRGQDYFTEFSAWVNALTTLNGGSGSLFTATSASSVEVGTGAKSFTLVETGRAFAAGSLVRVARTSDPDVYMAGTVTSYSGTTLAVTVTETGGSGTYDDWTITVNLDVTFASEAEAQAGTNNTKAMTPLRTAQAIAALAPVGDTLATARDPGAGWLLADGSVLLQSAYPALYDEIGDNLFATLEYVGTWGDTTNIAGIDFGGGLYVAVGAGGVIRTASDVASTWTTRTSGTAANLTGIAYNAALGLWCVVGNSGTILTASDPTGTWTARTAGSSYGSQFNCVVSLGADGFMAGGNANEIQYSADGVTWTRRRGGSGSEQFQRAAANSLGHVLFNEAVGGGALLTDDLGLNFSTINVDNQMSGPSATTVLQHVGASGADFYAAGQNMTMMKMIGDRLSAWNWHQATQTAGIPVALPGGDVLAIPGGVGRSAAISRAGKPFVLTEYVSPHPSGTLVAARYMNGAAVAVGGGGIIVTSAPVCDTGTEFLLPDLRGGVLPVYIKAEA